MQVFLVQTRAKMDSPSDLAISGSSETRKGALKRCRAPVVDPRRADDEKVRDRLVFLAEERAKELARLDGRDDRRAHGGAPALVGRALAQIGSHQTLAGYRSASDVVPHSMIDLDMEEIENM